MNSSFAGSLISKAKSLVLLAFISNVFEFPKIHFLFWAKPQNLFIVPLMKQIWKESKVKI